MDKCYQGFTHEKVWCVMGNLSYKVVRIDEEGMYNIHVNDELAFMAIGMYFIKTFKYSMCQYKGCYKDRPEIYYEMQVTCTKSHVSLRVVWENIIKGLHNKRYGV